MGTKISELIEKSILSDNDYLVVDNGADTAKYKATALLNIMFPVGSVVFNTDVNFNPGSTYGGTWDMVGSKLAVSENVVGNGMSLGLTDGSRTQNMVGSSQWALGVGAGYYAVGSSTSASTGTDNKRYGVPTLSQLGSNPENSGLIVVTETIYSWKRVA